MEADCWRPDHRPPCLKGPGSLRGSPSLSFRASSVPNSGTRPPSTRLPSSSVRGPRSATWSSSKGYDPQPDHPALGAGAGGRGHPVMDRRAFIAVAASLLTGPLVAGAQPAGKLLPRVAVVITTSPVGELQGPNPVHPHVRAFVHGLRDLGWIDGQTIVIERRSAEGKWDQVPALFADLVRSKVDVIVTLAARG